MRAVLMVAALAAMSVSGLAKPPEKPAKPAAKPAAAGTWIAICFGEDAQFTQTIGGAGFFHLGTGQRSYQTQKMVQSYFDGTKVCAIADPKAPRADSNVIEACADLTSKTVSVMSFQTAETRKVAPENATVFCKARIDVLQ